MVVQVKHEDYRIVTSYINYHDSDDSRYIVGAMIESNIIESVKEATLELYIFTDEISDPVWMGTYELDFSKDEFYSFEEEITDAYVTAGFTNNDLFSNGKHLIIYELTIIDELGTRTYTYDHNKL